jgi:hypothetical protein
MAMRWRVLSPVIPVLLNVGLQVSGYQNLRLAWLIWALAVVLALACWGPPVWGFLRRIRVCLARDGRETPPCAHEWLEQIAEQDDRDAARLLGGIVAYAKEFLGSTEPYLEIHVPMLNATVFEFTVLNKVEGAMMGRVPIDVEKPSRGSERGRERRVWLGFRG